MLKVGDKVKECVSGLDITGKTGVVVAAPVEKYGGKHVLVKLDIPDPENVLQLGEISLRETHLSRID